MRPLSLLFISAVLVAGCSSPEEEVARVVRRANIVSTEWNPAEEAGCYLGNGRFGAVFSGLGLNLSPEKQKELDTGQSVYSYMGHWGRFRFVSTMTKEGTSADYLLPLLKIFWAEEPSGVEDYRQELDFYDGVLDTRFRTDDGTAVAVKSWFDKERKDLSGLEIDLRGGERDVMLSVPDEFRAYPFVFGTSVHQEYTVSKEEDYTTLQVRCLESEGSPSQSVYVYSSAPVEETAKGLVFHLRDGRNRIFLSCSAPSSPEDMESSLKRTRAAWHREWSRTGWVDFPDDSMQKVWGRSLAYLLYSFDDDKYTLVQPTNGLTGNIYPFNYVQDMAYVAPVLEMTGHGDIVMRWVEKFAAQIPQMQAYAAKLWPGTEGIYPPWELPFGSIEGYHDPAVPVAFCYEPHNNGYLCRIAVEAAEYEGDEAWARQYVYPLVEEICRFYKSASFKGEDGLWHQQWYPCIGQDEAGGRNKSDYLCSLYSTEYAFRKAIELGLDRDGSLQAMLDDGLAFQSLASSLGTLHTCSGADDFGKQKHPVQLDGVAYFPRSGEPWKEECKAYELRHDITDGSRTPFFAGWTLGELLLSGSNLGDAEGWKEDWAKMQPARYADSDWRQIYETSGKSDASFYMPTHGMVAQSLLRNYVNDYWGTVEIGKCLVCDDKVTFGNIRTRTGEVVSGVVYPDGRSDWKAISAGPRSDGQR